MLRYVGIARERLKSWTWKAGADADVSRLGKEMAVTEKPSPLIIALGHRTWRRYAMREQLRLRYDQKIREIPLNAFALSI